MANSSTAVDLEQYIQDMNEELTQQIDVTNGQCHLPQPSSFPDSFVSAGHLQENTPPCNIEVDILNLKEVYDKIQKKIPISEQHIADGVVNMVVKTSGQVKEIRVFVQRSPQAAEKVNRKLEPVQLNVTYKGHEIYNTFFSIDLDSVYETPAGDKVYWLDKVEVDKRNIWQLIISVELIDGSMKVAYSNEFRIRTKPRESQSSAKRRKSHKSSYASLDSQNLSVSSGSSYQDDSPGRSTRQSSKVLADYLEAQRAQIQHLAVLNTMSTPNADIAYHLKLTERSRRRPNLEEGDVIGFLTNSSTGETEIEKLYEDNVKQAVMAGVISRSAYLYANVPDKEGETDTVCVIGLVKVKVMGTVQNGERIYAALDNPGVAVPETQIPLRRMADRTPTLLGQALESRTSRKLDTVHLVNCFVSIVLGIQSQQIASAIDNMQDRIHVNIKDTLERDRRRRLRGLRCKLIPVFMLAGLVVFLLFELLAPGSMYRYWRCRRGSIPGHTASFRFSTYDHQYPLINGVEFTWSALKKKADLESVDPYNATGYHCYLNLDRCAYGGVYLKREPQIRGPQVFIVNSTCTGVLYEEKNVWKYYTSAERIKRTPPCS